MVSVAPCRGASEKSSVDRPWPGVRGCGRDGRRLVEGEIHRRREGRDGAGAAGRWTATATGGVRGGGTTGRGTTIATVGGGGGGGGGTGRGGNGTVAAARGLARALRPAVAWVSAAARPWRGAPVRAQAAARAVRPEPGFPAAVWAAPALPACRPRTPSRRWRGAAAPPPWSLVAHRDEQQEQQRQVQPQRDDQDRAEPTAAAARYPPRTWHVSPDDDDLIHVLFRCASAFRPACAPARTLPEGTEFRTGSTRR